MIYISDDIPENKSPEQIGQANDLEWMDDDKWLVNSEIRYFIRAYKSQWRLYMVFIHQENAMQFICRYIHTYLTEHKALTFGKIMQRSIRKNLPTTFKDNLEAFKICLS